MKSPFAIFRKHAKVLLVFLTGLAMFAFIILDQLRPEHFPTVMAVLLCTGLFWYIGHKSGKGIEFAVGGAILGLVIGLGVPRFMAQGDTAVMTNAGNLSAKELDELMERRMMANRLVADIFYRTNESQFRQPPQFNFSTIQSDEQLRRDVVFGHLLRLEAERMGAQVPDEAVTEFIKDITGGNLSVAEFKEVRDSLRMSESAVYNLLREQLEAQLAMQLTTPRKLLTPDRYWELYKRMNVKQQLDVVPVPVEAFAEEIPDPSEAELQAFFEQYKNVFPNQFELGSPGFLQPRTFQLAYFEADFDTYKEKIEPVTDEAVEQYYAENKERLYRNRPFPTQPGAGGEMNPLDPQFAPETGPSMQGPNPETGDSPQPGDGPETQPDSGAPEADTPESPSDAPSNTEADTPPSDSDTSPESPDTAPESTPENNDNPTEDDPAAALAPSQAPFTLASHRADARSAAAGTRSGVFRLAAFQEETSDSETPQPESDSQSPADPSSSDEPAEPTTGDAPPTAEETADDQPSPAEDAAPETATDNSANESEESPAEPDASTPPQPEYRPLDDDLRADIRDQLVRQQTNALIEERLSEAEAMMYELGNEYHQLQAQLTTQEELGEKQVASQLAEKSREITDKMAAYAEQNALRYVTTPLISAAELRESEEYAIAEATERVSDPQQAQNARTVVDVVAQSQSELIYVPFRAVQRFFGNQYAYWIARNVEAHVPSLEDSGVRQQVLTAWKMRAALPKAKERAEQLAEILRNSDKSVEETFAGTTVTGQQDGEQVTVRETESFSWLRQSSAPPTNMFSRPRPMLSDISAVDGAGPQFMEVIFEELENNEIGVAPNAEKSVYYVVQVRNRTHASPEDRQALRQSFMQEDLFSFFSPYLELTTQEQQQANFEYRQQLQQKYAVNFLPPQTQPQAGFLQRALDSLMQSIR